MRLARSTSYDRAHLVWLGVACASVAWGALGCASAANSIGDGPPPPPCENASILEFSPEVPDSEVEAYSCFYYPLDLGGRSIASIRWHDPDGGAISLHHATLQVTSERRADGSPTSCEPMPADTISLHVHAPGGNSLELAPDIGLSLPLGAQSFRIEAHARRIHPGAATLAKVEVC